MKRVFFKLAFIAVLALGVCACSDDNESFEPLVNLDALNGTWTWLSTDGVANTSSQMAVEIFNADGTSTYHHEEGGFVKMWGTTNSTYTITKSGEYIQKTGDEIVKYNVVHLDFSTFVIQSCETGHTYLAQKVHDDYSDKILKHWYDAVYDFSTGAVINDYHVTFNADHTYTSNYMLNDVKEISNGDYFLYGDILVMQDSVVTCFVSKINIVESSPAALKMQFRGEDNNVIENNLQDISDVATLY